MQKKYFLPAALFILSLLLLSCSNKEAVLSEKEDEAKLLSKKAGHLWSIGKEIDALKLYDRLAEEFPETKAKKIAEDQLLKTGFSIGNSLTSWTNQQMFEMENTIAAYRDQKGTYPAGYEIKHRKDAWGNQIYFQLFPDKKNYDFIVFSNGPDKMKGTDDDLLLVHSKNENDEVTKRDQLSDGTAISTNQLRKMEDEKTSNSESDEMVLSLDELRKLERSKE